MFVNVSTPHLRSVSDNNFIAHTSDFDVARGCIVVHERSQGPRVPVQRVHVAGYGRVLSHTTPVMTCVSSPSPDSTTWGRWRRPYIAAGSPLSKETDRLYA
jgi:hypothetical protein